MLHRTWLFAPLLTLLPFVGSAACSSSSANPGASDGGTLPPYTGDSGMPNPGHVASLLATLGGSTYVFQIDSTNAYVLVSDNNTEATAVVKVPLSGGAPVTLASDLQNSQAIAVSGGTVYWVDPSGPPIDGSTSSDGMVMSVPTGGGSPTTVVSDQGLPESIAADASGIYWGDANVCTKSPCQGAVGAVMMLPPGGTAPVVLASVPASPQVVALDAANVYWGTGDGRVMKVAKSGGTVTTLAYYEASIQSLVVDSTYVYWTTGTGDIVKTPIAGGTSTAIVVGEDSIRGIAVDATSLYWATYPNNFTGGVSPPSTLNKAGLDGSAPETLWSGSDTPDTVEVDDTSVYFTTDSGLLFKLTPK